MYHVQRCVRGRNDVSDDGVYLSDEPRLHVVHSVWDGKVSVRWVCRDQQLGLHHVRECVRGRNDVPDDSLHTVDKPRLHFVHRVSNGEVSVRWVRWDH